jgi:hypothetical protein
MAATTKRATAAIGTTTAMAIFPELFRPELFELPSFEMMFGLDVDVAEELAAPVESTALVEVIVITIVLPL